MLQKFRIIAFEHKIQKLPFAHLESLPPQLTEMPYIGKNKAKYIRAVTYQLCAIPAVRPEQSGSAIFRLLRLM